VSDAIEELVANVVDCGFDALPAEAVDGAKRAVLDALAATMAGSTAPGVDEIVATLAEAGGRPEAGVAFFDERLPAHDAVVANVAMCHALEIDDSHYPAIVHPTAPTLWASLAAAEAMGGARGRDVLLAVALGTDLMARLGLAAPRTLFLGYHTAIYSGFGAAAAVGKLRGLDRESLRNALGLAFSQAAATVQAATDGVLAKRLQPAFNAGAGLRAVRFAERGVTGVRNVLEGRYGVFRLFNHGDGDRAALLDGLGRRFLGAELTTKRYPSSRCTHGAIEGAIALRARHGLRAADVAKVEVAVSSGCCAIAGAPFTAGSARSQTAAQFSIPYTVAAALKWGDVFIEQIQPAAIADPEALALAARVEVRAADGPAESFTPVHIRILTVAGAAHETTVRTLKGSPEAPLSWDEIVSERVERCRRHARRQPSDATLRRLIEAAASLDDLADATELVRLLRPA
jgi:2-methylcitrate dehydratase PrpD